MSKKFLVIPSNREVNLVSFFESWESLGDWDEVVVVEDGPERTFGIECDHHYSWKEIDETLGDDSWIISRQDSAIRSFGFLMAYRLGADYILTLDDDCYPYDDRPIFQSHIDHMVKDRWVESVPGMRTRGLPYRNLGTLSGVVANMGLWSKIPDLDAIQSLNDIGLATGGGFEPPKGSRVIPSGQFFPLCGMNYCFKAEVIPLAYFPLMGRGQPYGRFDDIWHGVIAKKVMDHLGMCITVGEPFVAHQRASDTFANLVKEAPGVRANETFWEVVDGIPLFQHTPTKCMDEVGCHLEISTDPYIKRLGEAIRVWSRQLTEDGNYWKNFSYSSQPTV